MLRNTTLGAFAALTLVAVCAVSQAGGSQVQTVNIDFGSGEAYTGDDGVLSSAGGAYWNKVSAADLFGVDFADLDLRDEFGGQTNLSLFSYDHHFELSDPNPDLAWSDYGLVVPPASSPLSTGIEPFGQGEASTVSLGRTGTFGEMVLYFATTPIGGGFTVPWDAPDVVQLFDPGSFVTQQFFGSHTATALHLTEAPIRGSGLAEWPSINISLPNNNIFTTQLLALQIRGNFYGAPEPSAAVLVSMLGLVSASYRARA